MTELRLDDSFQQSDTIDTATLDAIADAIEQLLPADEPEDAEAGS